MTDRAAFPILLWSALALIAAALFGDRVLALWPTAFSSDVNSLGLARVVLLDCVLPRGAMALVAGAALGLSGLMMQRVLRNPLAEPSTLGVSAGAQLALVCATLSAPTLMETGREAVALAGGLAAVALVVALTWRRGLEPVSVVLAGMMAALIATAASAALILANGEYMMSLFIWGGGSLVQQSWAPTLTVGSRLLIGLVMSMLLLRPLALLSLDDARARNLGLAPHAMRLVVLVIAVWLATTVVAEVGVIGFVGLAAPALATLSGARSLRQRLIAAPLVGAILLWLADGVVQAVFQGGSERVPAGAATALLGGPLLLWLLPRLRMLERPMLDAQPRLRRPRLRSGPLLGTLVVLAFGTAALALTCGPGPDGLVLASGTMLDDLLVWRGPRVGIAAACGVMLAAAGTTIQRVTGNPLASPELLGVGSGAGVGFAAVLFAAASPGLGLQLVGSAVGAITVLAIMLGIARNSGFGPERLLFAGVAMGALCSAVLTAVIATGNQEAFELLRWASGSINDAMAASAWVAAFAALALVVPLGLATRWLQILPLGETIAGGLGVPLRAGRLILILLAGLLTAAASLFVGPLSFVGLIAPHLARMLGLNRAFDHLAGAVAIGAILLTLSDWLSRIAAFPYQLPLGLFASLIGGPYLVWMLTGRANRPALKR